MALWALNVGPARAMSTAALADAPIQAFGHDLQAQPSQQLSHVFVAHFFDGDPAGTAGDFTAIIDWGDGTSPSPGSISTFNPSPPEFLVLGSHTYAQIGTYAVTVLIQDRLGASAVVASDALVGRERRLAATGAFDKAMWVRGSPKDTGWQSEDGILQSAPAITVTPASDGPTEPVYIGVGTDSALWVRTDSAGWTHLSTAFTSCLDSPAATVVEATGGPLLVVACEGTDHQLWSSTAQIAPGTRPQMGPFGPVGGWLIAGPAVVPDGSGVAFFVNEAGGVREWTASTGFVPTPWRCKGHLAAGLGGDLTTYFACHGTDDSLWYARHPSGGPWSGAQSAGGVLVDGPGIAAFNGDALVSVEGVDQAVYELNITRAGMATGYHRLGGSVQFGAGSVAILG